MEHFGDALLLLGVYVVYLAAFKAAAHHFYTADFAGELVDGGFVHEAGKVALGAVGYRLAVDDRFGFAAGGGAEFGEYVQKIADAGAAFGRAAEDGNKGVAGHAFKQALNDVGAPEGAFVEEFFGEFIVAFGGHFDEFFAPLGHLVGHGGGNFGFFAAGFYGFHVQKVDDALVLRSLAEGQVKGNGGNAEGFFDFF